MIFQTSYPSGIPFHIMLTPSEFLHICFAICVDLELVLGCILSSRRALAGFVGTPQTESQSSIFPTVSFGWIFQKIGNGVQAGFLGRVSTATDFLITETLTSFSVIPGFLSIQSENH